MQTSYLRVHHLRTHLSRSHPQLPSSRLSLASLRVTGARMLGEAGVLASHDRNGDARMGPHPDTVGSDGIANVLQRANDQNGPVDGFIAIPGSPDGTDDGLLAAPYTPRDVNGNAVYDHVEYLQSDNTDPDSTEYLSNQDTVGRQPQLDSEPDPLPQEDEQAGSEPEGLVRTGLSASGCSIVSSGSDAFLRLLTIISFAMLLRRFTLGRGPIV